MELAWPRQERKAELISKHMPRTYNLYDIMSGEYYHNEVALNQDVVTTRV